MFCLFDVYQFSTPIGSGSLTLLKAFVVACVIYVPGAAFASCGSCVNDLFSDVWIKTLYVAPIQFYFTSKEIVYFVHMIVLKLLTL